MAAPIKKKNPGFAWENWSSDQAVYSADGTAEQTMKLRSSYLCHMWFVHICATCVYLTKRTNKTPLSASHQLQQAQRIPQAPALVAGPVNWDLLSTQLELAHQCHVCCDGSHPRRTLATMMPRPSECFRIHWKSVDTTCNCKQPSARRPLLSSWWPSWYYKFLLYLFVIKMW